MNVYDAKDVTITIAGVTFAPPHAEEWELTKVVEYPRCTRCAGMAKCAPACCPEDDKRHVCPWCWGTGHEPVQVAVAGRPSVYQSRDWPREYLGQFRFCQCPECRGVKT